MRRSIPTILFVALLSSLLVIASALPAAGYSKQRSARVIPSAPRVVKCNQSATITARVVNTRTGKPVRLQTVKFTLVRKQHPRDRLSSRSGRTNGAGVTSVRVSFGPKAGPRTVKVSIPNSTPAISIRCAGGLPKTSIMPPPDYVETISSALLETSIQPPPPVTSVALLPATQLRMRRLGIDLPLVEGDGYSVPDEAVAHYPGTSWPGEGSNTYIYGHAREGHLLELWQVRTGDLIEIDMADGSVAEYEVSEIHPLVAWDALEYLDNTDREIVTLQTCLDYAETSPRFVVIAERLPPA